VFYEDGLEKIRELKACLEAGDIPAYKIHIHALKSAAANIGAVELSGTAGDLEEAGKRTDWDFINTHTAGFIDSLEKLLGNIFRVLSARRSEEGSMGADELKNRLDEIKAALETLDVGTANRILDDLLKLHLPEDIRALIQNISMDVLTAEYDEALALTESLIGHAGLSALH
jgi:HPt (histidine-containing phosphotransfer) domain-containing protein